MGEGDNPNSCSLTVAWAPRAAIRHRKTTAVNGWGCVAFAQRLTLLVRVAVCLQHVLNSSSCKRRISAAGVPCESDSVAGMLTLRSLCCGLLPVAFALVTSHLSPAAARSYPAPVPINQDFAGLTRVIDGDTIHVGDTRIRLEGIDAPESNQTCKRADGSEWPCGTEATRAMRAMVEGREVVCRNHGLDLYGRTLATCFIGNRNINEDMVRRGLAWAYVKYSRAYVSEETAARQAKLGVWQGEATPPWEFRAQAWGRSAEQAPTGCPIKGNVTAGGRIYHMPWSPWYGKVRIDGHPGKRWFCTETEAQAAGWRPAFTHRVVMPAALPAPSPAVAGEPPGP